METSFLDNIILNLNGMSSDASSITHTQCETAIDHYQFFQMALIPAILISLSFAATKQRRNILLSVLGGRPGLVYPMDSLTRSSRMSYACAFGATAFLVYENVLHQQYAINIPQDTALKSFVALVSMFIYGMVFYPLFASLAIGSVFGYGLGTLYVWMLTAVEIFKLTECDMDAKDRVLLVFRSLPSILCLLYLSVSLPARAVFAARKGRYFIWLADVQEMNSLDDIRDSYAGHHVIKLLRKPKAVPPPPEGAKARFQAALLGLIHRLLYKSQKGFRYPARMVSIMVVALLVVYMVNSAKYAGFQVGYIIWGYVLQFLVLTIVCFLLSLAIVLLIIDVTGWMLWIVQLLWPLVVTAVLIAVVQILLARFVFLQDRGAHIALNNRNSYFNFTYFMFFYNIFLGLMSCLLRIVKAIVLGVLFLCRLDNSTLPRCFEFFDPGFKAYVGYMQMEYAHTHPVIMVFTRFMYLGLHNKRCRELGVAGDGGNKDAVHSDIHTGLRDGGFKLKTTSSEDEIKRRKRVAARFSWQVAYTLLHNPNIRVTRKGYLQMLHQARLLGVHIPVSDRQADINMEQLQRDLQQARNKLKAGRQRPRDGQHVQHHTEELFLESVETSTHDTQSQPDAELEYNDSESAGGERGTEISTPVHLFTVTTHC